MGEGKEVNGVEIHATSYFKDKPIRRWLALDQGRSDVATLQAHDALQKDRLIIEGTRYPQAIELIKADLSRIYSGAGIEIDPKDFAEIAIYDTTKENIIEVAEGLQRGASDTFSNKAKLFPLGGAYFLTDIELLHHELDHLLGRRIVVVRQGRTILSVGETASAQMGFGVELMSGRRPGLFLDEGVVSYFSRDFILSSEDPIIVEARKKYLEGEGVDTKNKDEQTIQEDCKIQLEKDEPLRYKMSRLLIDTLISASRRIGDSEALEMKKDILYTRVNTKNMRSLMDRVDRLFVKRTFSKIYEMKFDGDQKENQIFINELRAMHGLE